MQSLIKTADDLAQGLVTAGQLTEACLDAALNPAGEGARTFISIDAETARKIADTQDTLRKAGRAPNRFAGIPISIKDLFDVAGQATTAGSLVLRAAPPAPATAPAIARLFAAGLVPIGRTNMTEFAFSGLGLNPHYGTPRAPYDRKFGRIPGGSTSGGAVSVADGMALAAIGTDTGGSCRIPAACCGLTGFKPTAARIPTAGVMPLSPTLDSVGPIAADVASCAALDAIMAGVTYAPLQARPATSLRLLLAQDFVLDGMDIPTESSFDRACATLARQGITLVARPLASFAAIIAANQTGGFAAAEAYARHRTYLAQAYNSYDPRVAARIMAGATMSAADYAILTWARTTIIAQFAADMDGFDAVLMPTIPIQPPKITDLTDDNTYRRTNFLLLRNPSLINFLDGCAISLPCAPPGAPPASLMLAAPAMHDHRLLTTAHTVELCLDVGG